MDSILMLKKELKEAQNIGSIISEAEASVLVALPPTAAMECAFCAHGSLFPPTQTFCMCWAQPAHTLGLSYPVMNAWLLLQECNLYRQAELTPSSLQIAIEAPQKCERKKSYGKQG